MSSDTLIKKQCDQTTQCQPAKKRTQRRRIQTSFLCHNLTPFPRFPRRKESVSILWKRRTKSMIRVCKSLRHFPSASCCDCKWNHRSEQDIPDNQLDTLPDDTTIITPDEMRTDELLVCKCGRLRHRPYEYIPWIRYIPRPSPPPVNNTRAPVPVTRTRPPPVSRPPPYETYVNQYASYGSNVGSYNQQGYQQYPYYNQAAYQAYNNVYYSQPSYPAAQPQWNYNYPTYYPSQ